MLQSHHARQNLALGFDLRLLACFIFLGLNFGLRERLQVPRHGADLAQIAGETSRGALSAMITARGWKLSLRLAQCL